jgi:hypothetical protein
MEVFIPSPTTKCPRPHARTKVASNYYTPVTPRVSPRRKGKRRYIYTPMANPGRKQWRMASAAIASRRTGDEDNIVVDAPRRAPKAKPQPQPKYKSRRSSQQHLASTPPPTHTSISVHTSSPSSSLPPSSRYVNYRSPTSYPPNSRAHRDSGTAGPPTNLAQSSFR